MKIQIVCIGCLVAVTLYHCFNPFQSKRGSKRKDNVDRNNGRSNWQTPPLDIMDMIIQRLNVSDRIRLSLVCKSWQSVAMRRDIHSAPRIPWFVVSDHHQLSNCNNYLSFSSLSEGRVGKLKLPKAVQGGWFQGCSKGWLIMVQEKGLNSEIFLFNPISGVQLQLPSLRTIPSFHESVKTTDWERLGAYKFCHQVELSTSDINSEHCMVAAIFGHGLNLCRPGDKTWSIFPVLDDQDQEQRISDILFSSSGTLYALAFVNEVSDDMNGIVATAHHINFGDNALQLKLIFSKLDSWSDNNVRVELHGDYEIELSVFYVTYLLESTTSNEVLVIQQLYDQFWKIQNHNGNDGNEEGNNVEANINEDGGEAGNGHEFGNNINNINLDEFADMQSDTSYTRTSGFKVFKVDPETGSFLIPVHNLGEEILFLADSNAFSLPTSDFKELQGSCIYFANNSFTGLRCTKPYICREIGKFYFDTGRIERCFPSVILSMRSKLAWLSPNL